MVKSLVRSVTLAPNGEHLHFEVSPEGTVVIQDEDPMPYVQYLEIGRFDGANSDPGQNDTSSQGELC